MSKKIIKLIEDIFKPAAPDEKQERIRQQFMAEKDEFIEKLRANMKNGVYRGDIDLDSKMKKYEMDTFPLRSINVVEGYIDVSKNDLTALKHFPKKVTFDFFCVDNKLTSLNGAPEVVKGNFYCKDNPGPNGDGFSEEYVRSVSEVKGQIIC